MDKSELNRLLESAQAYARDNDTDAILFLGSPTDPIPRALILDVDLPFPARVLWCYLRSLSDSPGAAGSAPSYDRIQQELGMKSRGTVASAVHALRITRWVTLLPQSVKNHRHLYLLHNAPLTYLQSADIDPGYPERIAEAIQSPSKHIRVLARRVLDGAMSTVESESHLTDINRLAGFVPDTKRSGEVSEQTFWNSILQRPPPGSTGTQPDKLPAEPEQAELVFHDDVIGFTSAMHDLAVLKIRQVPARYRQAFLDDLAVKVMERAGGDKPIHSPLNYLHWMVNQYTTSGDLPLSGKGELLPAMIKERDREHRRQIEQPIREELDRQSSELAHLNRLLSHGNPEDQWLRESLQKTETRVAELKAKLTRRTNGAS